MGYYKNEKETRATIDSKGFVHSGDIGNLNQNKVLSITGRIKELIITAGGENIPPVLIENQINTTLPLFSQVVLIGDKKKYLSCLFVLKTKAPGVLADELLAVIKSRGSAATTVDQAIACPEVKKLIEEGLAAANQKALSNAQKVQRYCILKQEFSVDGGELTPTLKLRRKIISQKYEAEINSMYPPEPKL
jgi:long-chain-fatty-acid--CoA ligase ACSBG